MRNEKGKMRAHAKCAQAISECRCDERTFKELARKGCKGHWDLYGMHERTKLVGGNLEVWSKLEAGTEIELSVPAATAYDSSTARRSSWFSGKGTAIES
jgi:hypothetical protein